jgi:hypothetical protein
MYIDRRVAWPPGPCIHICMIVFMHVMQREAQARRISVLVFLSLSQTQRSDRVEVRGA